MLKKVEMPNITTELVTITPQLAKEMMARNGPNRPIKPSVVSRIASDIKKGHWKLTGETIKFNINGELMDGQNRLRAVIETGEPIQTLVVTGIDADVMPAIDTGASRSMADILAIRGYEYCTLRAAAANWLLAIKQDNPHRSRTSRYDLLDNIEKHDTFHSAVRVFNQTKKSKAIGPPPSLMVAMHYIGSKLLKKPATADAFVTVFETGEMTYKGDAALVWRERLIRQQRKHEPMHRTVHLYGLIWAWNNFSVEKAVEQAQFEMPQKIYGLNLKRI